MNAPLATIVTAVLLLMFTVHRTTAAVSCAVFEAKEDCGYVGIQQEQCEERSCCWKPDEPGPWCYKPQTVTPFTYLIEGREDQGSTTRLALQLAAAVLPQYGPDCAALEVLLEAQTPQRLHVKISPRDSSSRGASGSRPTAEGAVCANRWEVPDWLIPRPPSEDSDPAARLYSVHLPQKGQPFSLTVAQRAAMDPLTDTPARAIFDTAGTKLVFKEQYLEITTKVAVSTMLYGLGETINADGSLALPRDGRTITLWNYDVAAFNAGVNLYGSHPFILQVHEDGMSSGTFLLNSNGMDVVLQQTSLTYRVIGGVLDFYCLMGPSPESVIQQYHQVIGRPAMPPYWALGFHQCRWGYRTLQDVEEVVAAYSDADIPLEVMWSDIDYMYKYRDFSFDQERFSPAAFRAFVDRLHSKGQHWMPITDCGIPHAPDDPAYTSGLAAGVFMRDVTGQPYLGQVWPGPTHYPDFLAVHRTWPWWKEQLQRMWQQVPFDGMWIDMNEASNLCDGEVCRLPTDHLVGADQHKLSAAGTGHQLTWWKHSLLGILDAGTQAVRAILGWPRTRQKPHPDTQHGAQAFMHTNCELSCSPPSPDNTLAFPPYAINNLHNSVPLGSKTLPMTAQHVDGQVQYNTHNLYGLSEAAATRWALEQITGKRSFILSRSTFPGSGRHTAHWTGDNAATWQDLRWSVQGLINSNMWGLAMAGADICGFQGDTNEELCARWIAAGALYTFTRNHNTLGATPQELYRWPAVAAAARQALALRYSLLPYLYTCLYRSHTEGGTVARPLFFEFPADEAARTLSTQWMWGRSILVAPVLQPGSTTVNAYLPAGSWYSLSDYSHYLGPATYTLTAPLTAAPPAFVRGGSIVATQVPHNTTAAVRTSPITLLVALSRGALPSHTTSASKGVTTSQQQLQHQHQDDTDQLPAQHGLHTDVTTLPNRAAGREAAGTSSTTPAAGSLADAAAACSLLKASHAACAACQQGAAPAGCRSSNGLLLGCGSLYWDDGDSLQVPSKGSVTVLMSSMAQPNTQRGWIMIAAEGVDVSADAAGWTKTPARAGDHQNPEAQQQGSVTRNVAAGRTEPQPQSGSSSTKAQSGQQGFPSDSQLGGAPAVQQVTVLGVQGPPAEEGQQAVAAVAVWLNGGRLPAGQVEYDAAREVLTVSGLQLQLGGVSRLEWRFGSFKEHREALAGQDLLLMTE